MKKIVLSLLFSALSIGIFAQDDIDLLDLIKDDSAAVAQPSVVQELPAPAPADDYDWRTQKHYLSLTYGTQSIVYGMGLVTTLEPVWDTRIGPFTIDYGYNIKHWLRVGGTFSYLYGEKVNERLDHVFGFVARVDFTYLNRRKVKLYSGYGMGVALLYRQRNRSYNYLDFEPCFNLCLIGVHAGGDHVFFLGECNFGTSEAFRAGIGFHF